jgi:ubiquinone/menaquinone biosynthesis C-methylase UbiE
MTLSDAKALINCDELNASQPQTWFDLGCGDGLFSKALQELLPEGSWIYAVDKQPTKFHSKGIKFLELDFVEDKLPEPLVNGILMANSIHFVKDKPKFLERIKKHILIDGFFLLVEYDMETSNRWVPYPISSLSATALLKQVGFELVKKISERKSLFNDQRIYSALFLNHKH